MDTGAFFAILMFATAFLCLMAGFPVAFTLAGVALLFGGIGIIATNAGVGDLAMDERVLTLMPERIYAIIQNEVLLAVPMFVLMGVVLERSKVAEELLETMGQLFGRVRGGLGISVTLVGALLAASTGIVGATVVTMGLLSLPTMMRHKYDPKLATGAIAAAGTLGQIIPPSIVLVLLGDVISTAYQKAQQAKGNFAPEPVAVGDLFMGALVPGLLLVFLYILYQIIYAALKPEAAPPFPPMTDRAEERGALIARLVRALVAPILLVVAVLGSIMTGLASPTQAASVGAIGAIMLGAWRACPPSDHQAYSKGALILAVGAIALMSLIVLGKLTDLSANGSMVLRSIGFLLAVIGGTTIGFAAWRLDRSKSLRPALTATVTITTMVYTILIGAALFSLVFRGLGGDRAIEDWLGNLPGGQATALLVTMLIIFVLGFFLDFIEITFVVVPIVGPVLLGLGVDPIWLGVLIAINLQTSFLTPPFGFALFYLRGVAPPEVTTGAIYRGAIPFVIIQLATLALIAAVPALATALPNLLRAG
ncbi:MAG: TRAP transporter large permease subunit [Pseudomonadota bacterium]